MKMSMENENICVEKKERRDRFNDVVTTAKEMSNDLFEFIIKNPNIDHKTRSLFGDNMAKKILDKNPLLDKAEVVRFCEIMVGTINTNFQQSRDTITNVFGNNMILHCRMRAQYMIDKIFERQLKYDAIEEQLLKELQENNYMDNEENTIKKRFALIAQFKASSNCMAPLMTKVLENEYMQLNEQLRASEQYVPEAGSILEQITKELHDRHIISKPAKRYKPKYNQKRKN